MRLSASSSRLRVMYSSYESSSSRSLAFSFRHARWLSFQRSIVRSLSRSQTAKGLRAFDDARSGLHEISRLPVHERRRNRAVQVLAHAPHLLVEVNAVNLVASFQERHRQPPPAPLRFDCASLLKVFRIGIIAHFLAARIVHDERRQRIGHRLAKLVPFVQRERIHINSRRAAIWQRHLDRHDARRQHLQKVGHQAIAPQVYVPSLASTASRISASPLPGERRAAWKLCSENSPLMRSLPLFEFGQSIWRLRAVGDASMYQVRKMSYASFAPVVRMTRTVTWQYRPPPSTVWRKRVSAV